MESLQRPRQNGKLRGRKNPFYCKLEKTHFTEKIIAKLVVENSQVFQDPKATLTEQKKLRENI